MKDIRDEIIWKDVTSFLRFKIHQGTTSKKGGIVNAYNMMNNVINSDQNCLRFEGHMME